MVEFHKVLDASKKIIAISFVFNLIIIVVWALMTFAEMGTTIVTRGGLAMFGFGINMIIAMLVWGLWVFEYIGNFFIYAYSGFRAAKRGLSLVECGLVGLFSYAVVGLVTEILKFAVGLLFAGATAASSSSDAAVAMFMGALGLFGAVMRAICAVGFYFAGLVMNFTIALITGLIGGAK